jgi:hypothetical protein
MSLQDRFSLKGKVAVITGGAGLMGREHGAAIVASFGTSMAPPRRQPPARSVETSVKWTSRARKTSPQA